MKEWSEKDVLDWLKFCGFSKEIQKVASSQQINGMQLLVVDNESLKSRWKIFDKTERAEFISKRNKFAHKEEEETGEFMNATKQAIEFSELKFLELLGSGNFARVKRADLKGKNVAVKIIERTAFKNKNAFQIFQQEVDILSLLNHRNILKFIGTCRTPNGNYCIITEFMGGGTLRNLINECFHILNTNGLRRQIIKSIASAMIYLHGWKPSAILHRDLTSHNLLLDKDRVCKLADFGLSRLRDDEHTMTGSVGNLPWIRHPFHPSFFSVF